jgi:peptidoglycan biosynthesis protein MviN/MurJ (putative lipid II flippase)|tara:strand:+ start:320 stop:550 length:231 start_codon:yes stop_codon:yes gene_type:complete
MESLFEALAFLIQAITIGGIAAVLLALVGVIPIQVNRYIEINVSDDAEAKKILKSWGIIIGANGEIQDEEDSKDEL